LDIVLEVQKSFGERKRKNSGDKIELRDSSNEKLKNSKGEKKAKNELLKAINDKKKLEVFSFIFIDLFLA
jgi:hypothetical protein